MYTHNSNFSSNGNCIFNFLKNFHTFLLWLHELTFPSTMYKDSLYSTSTPTLVIQGHAWKYIINKEKHIHQRKTIFSVSNWFGLYKYQIFHLFYGIKPGAGILNGMIVTHKNWQTVTGRPRGLGACFCKCSFIGTQLCLLIHISFVAAFTIQLWNWIFRAVGLQPMGL